MTIVTPLNGKQRYPMDEKMTGELWVLSGMTGMSITVLVQMWEMGSLVFLNIQTLFLDISEWFLDLEDFGFCPFSCSPPIIFKEVGEIFC